MDAGDSSPYFKVLFAPAPARGGVPTRHIGWKWRAVCQPTNIVAVIASMSSTGSKPCRSTGLKPPTAPSARVRTYSKSWVPSTQKRLIRP